ncbi:MAG: LysR family transcriptional regulator [Gammaproteobacteria bacterium]
MDRIRAMQVFIEVSRREGFAAAARQLHLSTTAVSRNVMELEDWLGVQLFNRTTRHLSLTEAGRAYLERCTHIVNDVDNLENISRDLHQNPQGRIKVTAPVFMGRQFLSPILPEFLQRYPGIAVNLHLVDRYVNLVDEGFDVALRIAKLADSNLVSRRLGAMRMVMVAAPSFIEKYGVPESLNALQNFNCVVDSVADYHERWPLIDHNGPVNVRVESNLSINSGELVRDMVIAGVGISILPDFFVAEDLRAGRLILVLPDGVNKNATISAVYPQGRYLSSSVRVFIDFLVEHAGILSSPCLNLSSS